MQRIVCIVVFLLQAEVGIRDLVRSRGLGDVYKRQKETGIFPVFEAEHGEVKSALAIRRPLPVEEYLRPQKRFAHLFGKNPAVATIARIQAQADKNLSLIHI